MKFKSNVELEALSNATTDTDKFIVSDSNTLKYRTGSQVLSDIGGQAFLINPVTGVGTTNFLPKFTFTSTLANSLVFDNGTNVGIGTTSPSQKLQVVGNIGVGDGTYNGGVYANSSTSAVDTNWGFDFLKTAGQNNYSTRLKYYPATGEDRKGGIWNSLSNTWVLYGDSNNTPNVIIPTGNVGLGVTPSAWESTTKALQINGGSIYAANTYTFIGSNIVYTSAGDQYINTGFATVYGQLSGEHRWYNAPSGTAGNAISFTQAMTLAASGNVLIGTTTDNAYKLRVNGNGRYDDYLQLWTGTSGASPRLIFGGETSNTDKSIFLESFFMVFQGHNNEGFKFQTTSSAGVVSNRMSVLGNGTIVLSNYGTGSKTGTRAYDLSVDASGNIIEVPVGAGTITGTGTTNFLPKWTSGSAIGDSIIYETSNLIGIGTTSPTQGGGNAKWVTIDGASYSGGIVYSINSVAKGYTYVESDLLKVQAQAGVGISFITNGNESARITSAGNVGIGTSSPSGKLDVAYDMYTGAGNSVLQAGAYGNINFKGGSSQGLTTTQQGITWQVDSYGGTTNYGVQAQIAVGNNGNVGTFMGFFTSDNYGLPPVERLRIKHNGEVGIGTSSPDRQLEVMSTTGGTLRLKRDDTSLENNDTIGTVEFFTNDADGPHIASYIKGLGADLFGNFGRYGALAFGVSVTANTDAVEIMRITEKGNVGIGTTTPNLKLRIQESGASPVLAIQNTNANGYSGAWLYNSADTLVGHFGWANGTTTTLSDKMYFGTIAAKDVVFTTNDSEKVRITSAGNVGIGTTSPAYKLDVNGTTRISGATTLSNYTNGVLAVNSTGLIKVEPTYQNLSLGESYANVINEYYFRNGYTLSPTDAGYQYAKLIQQGLLNSASLVLIPQAVKPSLLALNKPNIDLTFTRTADTATRVNSAGLIESVLANIPRIDYTGGGCGKLLLEPQRTNLTQYSEQLNNGYWNKTGSTATANAIVSPDGFQNADLLTESATTADHAFFDVVSYFVSGTTYTLSFFAKANGRTKVEVVSANSGTCPTGRFDLVAQTATPLNDSFGAKIENYGNGWFRCSVSRVAPNTGLDVPYHTMVQSFGTITYAGDGTSGMYFWGMQTEVGSYVSSYIPTLGAQVTRSADAASKTGISSLIGQTEGTLFAEIVVNGAQEGSANIINSEKNTTASFAIQRILSGTIFARLFISGSAVELLGGDIQLGQRTKIAFAYKTGSSALFQDGVLVASSSSAFVLPSTLDDIFLGDPTAFFGSKDEVSFNQTLLFKTRLSNADLAALTA